MRVVPVEHRRAGAGATGAMPRQSSGHRDEPGCSPHGWVRAGQEWGQEPACPWDLCSLCTCPLAGLADEKG